LLILKGEKEPFTDIIIRLSKLRKIFSNMLVNGDDKEAEDFFKIIEEAWLRWHAKRSA
jgi:predicted CopG family antitoxin